MWAGRVHGSNCCIIWITNITSSHVASIVQWLEHHTGRCKGHGFNSHWSPVFFPATLTYLVSCTINASAVMVEACPWHFANTVIMWYVIVSYCGCSQTVYCILICFRHRLTLLYWQAGILISETHKHCPHQPHSNISVWKSRTSKVNWRLLQQWTNQVNTGPIRA